MSRNVARYRTIGYLNILCGVLLAGCGGGCLALIGPFLAENRPLRVAPELADDVAEAIRQSLISELRQLERTAAPGEKDQIAKAREELAALGERFSTQVNFDKINSDLPWIGWYMWIDLISGMILNVALTVSGVALVRGWKSSRSVAVNVAALKLTRLVAIVLLACLVVVPKSRNVLTAFATSKHGETLIQGAMWSSSTGALPPVRLQGADIVTILTSSGYLSTVLMLSLGAVYPLIVLIVLTRRPLKPEVHAGPPALPVLPTP